MYSKSKYCFGIHVQSSKVVKNLHDNDKFQVKDRCYVQGKNEKGDQQRYTVAFNLSEMSNFPNFLRQNSKNIKTDKAGVQYITLQFINMKYYELLYCKPIAYIIHQIFLNKNKVTNIITHIPKRLRHTNKNLWEIIKTICYIMPQWI